VTVSYLPGTEPSFGHAFSHFLTATTLFGNK
jgi:hypothetical protein